MNKQFTAVVVAALITGGAWTISTYAQARGQEARPPFGIRGLHADATHDLDGLVRRGAGAASVTGPE